MKLFYKYYLMISVPLILCLLIIGFGLSLQMYNYSVADKHDSLYATSHRISALVEDLLHSHAVSREQVLKTVITTMTEDGKTHVILCDANGSVFLTSDRYGSSYIGEKLDDRILAKTANANEFSSTGTLGGLYSGENYSVGCVARGDFGEPIAYIYATTSINNIRNLMSYVKNLFSFLSLFVFALTAFASYFILKHMTKPLKQISDAATAFAQGDFSVRVPIHSTDEIGELTLAFNNMADSIEKSEELRKSFIGNVSHELRSPMTSISGFVDGILDGTIPKEREEHYLQIVSDEAHRLSRLVSRMLDITILQSTDITEHSTRFDFVELLSRAIKNFEQRVADAAITFNIDIPPHSILVLANEDSIYQVIYNLIDNAVKFSAAESSIDISIICKNDKLLFSIKNYGAEIPEDELKSVFDRFHKTDKSRSRDRSGLGLGLYIAKTIIQQHKGKISADSGEGYTSFTFTLPL